MEKTKNFVIFAVFCSHKPFIFRVFGVFRGLNCRLQPSLSVSICVHSPRCRAVAAGPWLTLLPSFTEKQKLGKLKAGQRRREGGKRLAYPAGHCSMLDVGSSPQLPSAGRKRTRLFSMMTRWPGVWVTRSVRRRNCRSTFNMCSAVASSGSRRTIRPG